jgi:hypothetical protein
MAAEPSSQQIDPPQGKIKQRPRISRGALAASVAWFFGLLVLICTLLPPVDEMPAWLVFTYIAGSLAWVVSAYCIYHALFAMAEVRWPEAKRIRAILSPILRDFLFHR